MFVSSSSIFLGSPSFISGHYSIFPGPAYTWFCHKLPLVSLHHTLGIILSPLVSIFVHPTGLHFSSQPLVICFISFFRSYFLSFRPFLLVFIFRPPFPCCSAAIGGLATRRCWICRHHLACVLLLLFPSAIRPYSSFPPSPRVPTSSYPLLYLPPHNFYFPTN